MDSWLTPVHRCTYNGDKMALDMVQVNSPTATTCPSLQSASHRKLHSTFTKDYLSFDAFALDQCMRRELLPKNAKCRKNDLMAFYERYSSYSHMRFRDNAKALGAALAKKDHLSYEPTIASPTQTHPVTSDVCQNNRTNRPVAAGFITAVHSTSLSAAVKCKPRAPNDLCKVHELTGRFFY